MSGSDKEWIERQGQETPELGRLQSENTRLSKLLGLVESYHGQASPPPTWLSPPVKPAAHLAATACIQFSDWHLDEVVNPAEVGGHNAYNREIAEMRLRRWADKSCELGERFRHSWDGALIMSNGDLVSGAIHEELRETNAAYLPETMVHWAPLIAGAYSKIADFYGRVHVPVTVGNHGRLTHKPQAKGRIRNSWDWLLMQMVRAHLAKDERFTWDFAQSPYIFVSVYKDTIYQTHGDEVKGGGGWAGVWSPLGTIHRRGVELAAVKGIQVSYVCVGHWHQLVSAHHRGIACNGAGKGYDEYAVSLRFRPEPASQGWWTHTPKRGVTVAAPIFLEDRKAEGW